MAVQFRFEEGRNFVNRLTPGPVANRYTHLECVGNVVDYDPDFVFTFGVVLSNPEFNAQLAYITHLDISHLQMGDVRFHYMVRQHKFLSRTGLLSITATNNNLSDVALMSLATSWPPTLQHLDLSNNRITDAGFIMLVHSFGSILNKVTETNIPHFHTLVLAKNRLKKPFTNFVARFFMHQHAFIQRIDLRGCPLDIVELVLFVKKLADNDHGNPNTTLRALLVNAGAALFVCEFFKKRNWALPSQLSHLTMQKDEILLQMQLHNYICRPTRKELELSFNHGLKGIPRLNFNFKSDLLAQLHLEPKWFKPWNVTQFQYTSHPFYSMMMTMFLCNRAFSVVLPDHILLYIFSFGVPLTFPNKDWCECF